MENENDKIVVGFTKGEWDSISDQINDIPTKYGFLIRNTIEFILYNQEQQRLLKAKEADGKKD